MAWPSADWGLLHPLVDAGRLPTLQALIERGTLTTLVSAAPLTREALLTTLATGMRADRHGVLAPLQVRADGGGVEGVGRRSWRAPAFWDVLQADGIPSACVNWPATAPADGASGVCVDDSFAAATGIDFSCWAMPPRSVSPQALAAELIGLRVHPADDLRDYVRLFVRDLEGAGKPALAQLRTMLARCVTAQAAALHVAETRPWRALCVCYDFVHTARAAFGHAAAGDALGDVVAQAAVLLDMMLGRLVALAGDGATVAVVSPNGLSVLPGGELRPFPRGMMVVAGPGIAADAVLAGARLEDVAPTLAARFGIALRGDGRVQDALAPAGGDFRTVGMAPAEQDTWDPAAALLAEGYRDALSPAQMTAIDDAECLRTFHLGIALMARDDLAQAAQVLEAVRARRPTDTLVLRRLARCRARMGEYAACRALGEALVAADPYAPWGHLVLATWAALGEEGADPEPYLVSARELGAGMSRVLIRLGGLELVLGRGANAAADFEAACGLDAHAAEAAYGAGVARMRMGDVPAAERWLRRAIALEHHQPLAHAQLGSVLRAQGRFREAVLALETAAAQSGGSSDIAALLEQARLAQGHEAAAAAAGRYAAEIQR